MPNGKKYSFTYDSTYGLVSKISFPDGGYARYVWGLNASSEVTYQTWVPVNQTSGYQSCDLVFDTAAITDRYVSYDGTTEVLHQHFTYSTTWTAPGNSYYWWTSKTTTVTNSDLLTGQSTIIKYTYSPVSADVGPNDHSSMQPFSVVPVEQTVLYEDGTGHVLKTVNKSWLNSLSIIGQQTILDNNQGSATLRCYGATEQVIGFYEYGFQSEGAKPADPACGLQPVGGTTLSFGLNTSEIGPLRRSTATAYHNFLGASPSTNIVNEPDSITVSDGSGNQLKQLTFTYTESVQAPLVATGVGLVSPPGLRGNIGSVSYWLNVPSSATLNTSYSWFNNGDLQSRTDARGNTTSYSYTDSFTGGAAPSPTNAFPTLVTYPNTGVPHTESFSWGYSDGQPRSHTDQNGKITTYAYNDPLDRITQIQSPDGGTTTYAYNDASPNPTVSTSKLIGTSGQYLTTVSTMDGIGHVIKAQLTSDSTTDCSSGIDTTATSYDGFGRVLTKSNAYCTTSDPTYGITTYAYDALGRATSVTNPDSTTLITTYSGAATSVQDEGNGIQRVTRISQTDGLGRLSSVCEVAAGLSSCPQVVRLHR